MTNEQKEKKIKELLTRSVANIYPSYDFLEKLLKSGKQVSIYLGIDPTGNSLHLGHAINLMKLKQFQELGHKVILLIGSFTAMIGDPDKKDVREQLTKAEVLKNCENYQKQASKILDFEGSNPVELKYNDQWLSKLDFEDILNIASNFTVQRLLERDMFQLRIKEGRPIYLHEFLYPLMQGYDSVYMEVDGELGGNDQTFNMLAGRNLMKAMKNKEKFVIACKLLVDTKGVKMGKTKGNMLTLDDNPNQIFGKVMSWTDTMIGIGFELCTYVSMDKVNEIKSQLAQSEINPRDLKMDLAYEIAKIYYGKEAAESAKNNFISQFKEKGKPKDIPRIKIEKEKEHIVEILLKAGFANSKSEARRVIQQGGVRVDGKVVDDINALVEIKPEGTLIQKGKLNYVKVFK
jgi:tyrosyl-tRNA synthetase